MKRRLTAILILAAMLITILSALNSCGIKRVAPPPKKRIFYDFFDTVGTFYDYSGTSDEKFNARADKLEESLSDYHRLYDIYNEYEGIVNLATLNRLAGEGAQRVDKRIINLLLFAKEMYALTEGEVNVAMGSVLKLWHDARETGQTLPDSDALRRASEHTDINGIIIDEENLTVELLDPEMRLDVGAVAKGYAVEMVAEELIADGVTGCVIDVGGNLRAIGSKPDGSGWTAGIKNPNREDGGYVSTLTLKDKALVTSGSYERYYEVDGVRYHHIIDKDTLYPSAYYASVSVMSDNSALCDALSTALFNMDFDSAKTLVESLGNVTAVFVFADGEVSKLGEIC